MALFIYSRIKKNKGKIFAVLGIILILASLSNVVVSNNSTSLDNILQNENIGLIMQQSSVASEEKDYSNTTTSTSTSTSVEMHLVEQQEHVVNNTHELDADADNDADSDSDQTSSSSESSSSSTTASLFGKDEICSYFPSQSFTASSIWQMHLDEIFNASHNPAMPQELSIFNNTKEAEKMYTLLHDTLAPSRMRKGILHMPTLDSTHDTVKHVIRILENRIRDPVNNPPLKIAVFGGSVTIGRDCYRTRIQYKDCAWPRRFELLVNQFVGMELIKIYNLGIGGTSTSTARNMVDYWMYPQDLKTEGPDVIINSYSTNGKGKIKKMEACTLHVLVPFSCITFNITPPPTHDLFLL